MAALYPSVISTEVITLELGDSDTVVTQALSKSQTLSQCAPCFVTREHNEDSATADAQADHSCVRVRLYDNAGTPTLECQRYAAGNNSSIKVTVHVLEFHSDITVRSGLTTVGDGGTYTLGGHTDSAYTWAVFSHYFTGTGGNGDDVSFEVGLTTTANQLVMQRETAGSGTAYFAWYTIEDDTAGDHWVCQHVSAAVGGFSSFANATISAVTMAKTFVIGGARSQYENYGGSESSFEYYLNSTTQVSAAKQQGGANRTCNVRWQVVELQYADAQVERGEFGTTSGVDSFSIALAGTFSKNSAAHTSYFMGFWSGDSMNSVSSYYATYHIRMQLNSAGDEIDCVRNSNSLGATNKRWEAIDFGSLANRRIFIT